MPKQNWTEQDHLIALYLARTPGGDGAVERAFIERSGHTKQSLKMAISNFRYLLTGKGLANVSAAQRRVAAQFGGLSANEIKARLCLPPPADERLDPTLTSGSSSGRRLNETELKTAWRIIASVRAEIDKAAGGDMSLLWAIRRKVYKELIYDERSKPMARRLLKAKLFAKQPGLCAECKGKLPDRYSVLDRRRAMDGYTESNCQLLCPNCDQKTQAAKGYK